MGKLLRFIRVRVPSFQTTFVSIIKEIISNLWRGVHQLWVDVFSLESIPNFGAYAFVQLNESELHIWVGRIILTQRPDGLPNNNLAGLGKDIKGHQVR
jgi:hypothetical protein